MEMTTKEIIAWAEDKRRQMTIFGRSDVQSLMVHSVNASLVEAGNLLAAGHLRISNIVRIIRLLWLVKRILANEIPEPTKENTWNPNTRVLIDIQDYIFDHIKLTKDRTNTLRVISKYIIYIYDYATPYRRMIDRCVMMLKASDWQPSPPPSPNVWKEDNYGDSRTEG